MRLWKGCLVVIMKGLPSCDCESVAYLLFLKEYKLIFHYIYIKVRNLFFKEKKERLILHDHNNCNNNNNRGGNFVGKKTKLEPF